MHQFQLSPPLAPYALAERPDPNDDKRQEQIYKARALIHSDLGRALYMVGGTSAPCSALARYAALPGLPNQPVQLLHAVSAEPARQPWGPQSSERLCITVAHQQLLGTGSRHAPRAHFKWVPHSVDSAPWGQQAVRNGVLPLNSTDGIAVGDVVALTVAVAGGRLSGLACLQFPVAALGWVRLSSGRHPALHLPSPGKLADFNPALREIGLLADGQGLSDTLLAAAPLKNLGAPHQGCATQHLCYYLKPLPSAQGPVPMLLRGVCDADGAPIAAPTPIASGVVSLQLLFGVDGNNAVSAPIGQVSHYLRWEHVVQRQLCGRVRTVLYALVVRAMQSKPEHPKVTLVPIASPALGVDSDCFYPFVPRNLQEQHDHYTVHCAEVVLREHSWAR